MVIQGNFHKLIALTATFAWKCSICNSQSTETATRGFVSFQKIGIMLCQLKCTEHGPCVAVEYNKDSLSCRLLSMKSKKAEEGGIVRRKLEADVLKGPCFFKNCTQMMRCLETRSGKAVCAKELRGMYEWCADDNTCYINGSVCFKGQCKCNPGLSYHRADQACVRKCDVYGNTMTTYDGLGIISHNLVSYTALPEEECIRLCVNETNFLCRSVEKTHRHGTYKLSDVGYLDVDISYRESGLGDWYIGLRDCETY